MPLTHMQPSMYLDALAATVKQHGRQLQLSPDSVLPDRPTGRDPTSCNSSKLAPVGRSTAIELKTGHESHAHILHKVDLPGFGDAWVMPRSLLWRLRGDDAWTAIPIAQLQTTPETAAACASMATENDGQALRQLWKNAGILYQRRPNGPWVFNELSWYRHRYYRVVVLGYAAAARFWKNDVQQVGLCPCLPMALSGRCEHEQFVEAVQGTMDLSVVGNQGRGRPRLLQWARGISSRAVFGSAPPDEIAAVAGHESEALPPGPLLAALCDASVVRVSTSAPGAASSSGSSPQHQIRGPYASKEFMTDVTRVADILSKHGVVLPAGCKIYRNAQQAAWVAWYMPNGRPVITKSASEKKYGDDEKCIIRVADLIKTAVASLSQ